MCHQLLCYSDVVITEFFVFRSRAQSDFVHYSLKLARGPKLLPASTWYVLNCPPYVHKGYLLHEQFANKASLDFDDVLDQVPTQEFNVPQSRDVGEYVVQ